MCIILERPCSVRHPPHFDSPPSLSFSASYFLSFFFAISLSHSSFSRSSFFHPILFILFVLNSPSSFAPSSWYPAKNPPHPPVHPTHCLLLLRILSNLRFSPRWVRIAFRSVGLSSTRVHDFSVYFVSFLS